MVYIIKTLIKTFALNATVYTTFITMYVDYIINHIVGILCSCLLDQHTIRPSKTENIEVEFNIIT